MRKVPRFSPSFGLGDARTALRALRGDDDVERVFEFEKAFALAMGTRYAVMVPSGRYGCFLALEALGIQTGDEVILPALTYFAVAAMVELLGARPVFADVGIRTHVLDPASVAARITPRTRAILATHLYGTPCDMDALGAIARKHNVRLVEDCCQAAGASHRERRVGSIGIAGFFTFGITKNMTSILGGMVTTHDRRVAEQVRSRMDRTELIPRSKVLREALVGSAMAFATSRRVYASLVHPLVRFGTALGRDPIEGSFGETEHLYERLPPDFEQGRPRAAQAAVGLGQLARLDHFNATRRAHANQLETALAGTVGLDLPSYPAGSEPIAMSYVVEHDQREVLARRLRRRGVDTAMGFMANLGAHALFPESQADCPNAAAALRRMLHLPVHPGLDPRDVDGIARVVREEAGALR